jgi:hypothetical protein
MSRLALVVPVPLVAFLALLAVSPGGRVPSVVPGADDEACASCHEEVTPGAVGDWRASRHAVEGTTCSDCHGDGHMSADDVLEVELPTPGTCETCHSERVEQYAQGKHALAWAAMKAMPTLHWQPVGLIQGLKGCGGCHKIGLKSDEEIVDLKLEGHRYGVASCDACHTRHTFSVAEARQPEACQTCHMGFDHPQWEMYSSSKHGVRHGLKRDGVLPETAAAPTCQTCHMPGGDHAVGTSWGFLAVSLPMPDDERWTADRTTILKGLGVLTPDGEPTARLQAVRDARLARLDYAEWFDLREKMVAACTGCHAETYARAELEKGDDQIREIDHLMAEAIRVVAGLYEDGTIAKPESYAAAFPDLLTFHDAATTIEQRLFVMFLKHRMRAFQGAFHMNPDYALWYGWSEMVMDLTDIREMAAEMRLHRRLGE